MGYYEAKRNAIFIFLINEFRFPLTGQISVRFFRRPTRLTSLVRLARCRRPRRARREAITKQCEPSLIPRVSSPLQAPAGRPSQNNVNLASINSSCIWPAAGARREAPRREALPARYWLLFPRHLQPFP